MGRQKNMKFYENRFEQIDPWGHRECQSRSILHKIRKGDRRYYTNKLYQVGLLLRTFKRREAMPIMTMSNLYFLKRANWNIAV